MKIFQVLNSLDCGGLEKLTLDLSLKLMVQGHSVTICCLKGAGNLLNSSQVGIEIISLNKRSGLDFILPFRLAGEIRQRRPDIVHTHNPGPLFYGTIAARLAGVPVVINTRHGRAPRYMNRFIWAMNDAIVAISNDAKNELLKNNTIDPGKVFVIHNGIDLDRFKSCSSQQDAKKALGLDSSLVIGTVSRLSREKDQFNLIKAFAKIVSVDPDVRLVFAGDGPLRNELMAFADDLGLKDKVTFLGFRDDVNMVMQSFDIFVLPSLQEGISLSLLEAMASAKPVIVTNVGGNPEVVIDGETGFFVAPKNPHKLAEACTRLLKNVELSEQFGFAGRRRVEEKFSLSRMVGEYNELYKRCLK